jgi:hypothetical protein
MKKKERKKGRGLCRNYSHLLLFFFFHRRQIGLRPYLWAGCTASCLVAAAI